MGGVLVGPGFVMYFAMSFLVWRKRADCFAYCIHAFIHEPRHGISNHVGCATSKGSDQPAHTRSLIRAFASRLNIL